MVNGIWSFKSRPLDHLVVAKTAMGLSLVCSWLEVCRCPVALIESHDSLVVFFGLGEGGANVRVPSLLEGARSQV